MAFEFFGNLHKLVINLGHIFFKFVDMLRRANAGDDIFALRVGQVISKQLLFSGGRIPRKSDARAGIFTHVAENHRDYIDGSSEIIRNLFAAPVGNGPISVPRSKNGFDGFFELLIRIRGKIRAGFRANDFFKLPADGGKIFGT